VLAPCIAPMVWGGRWRGCVRARTLRHSEDDSANEAGEDGNVAEDGGEGEEAEGTQQGEEEHKGREEKHRLGSGAPATCHQGPGLVRVVRGWCEGEAESNRGIEEPLMASA
jgi:hypothetical protein